MASGAGGKMVEVHFGGEKDKIYWPNDKGVTFFKYKAAKKLSVQQYREFHLGDVDTRERLERPREHDKLRIVLGGDRRERRRRDKGDERREERRDRRDRDRDSYRYESRYREERGSRRGEKRASSPDYWSEVCSSKKAFRTVLEVLREMDA